MKLHQLTDTSTPSLPKPSQKLLPPSSVGGDPVRDALNPQGGIYVVEDGEWVQRPRRIGPHGLVTVHTREGTFRLKDPRLEPVSTVRQGNYLNIADPVTLEVRRVKYRDLIDAHLGAVGE